MKTLRACPISEKNSDEKPWVITNITHILTESIDGGFELTDLDSDWEELFVVGLSKTKAHGITQILNEAIHSLGFERTNVDAILKELLDVRIH